MRNLLYGLLCGAAIVCGCSGPEQTAGNTSSSSNAFTISGTTQTQSGSPAVNAAVYIRPENFYPGAGTAHLTEKAATHTDANGVFTLAEIRSGYYSIEVRDSAARAVLVRVRVVDQDIQLNAKAVLKPMGAIKGMVVCPGAHCPQADSFYISVKGLWRSGWADVTGHFTVKNIPEGIYTVRFDAPWAMAQQYVGLVERAYILVEAGDTTDMDTIRLQERSTSQNDTSYQKDARAVQAILDSNRITRPLEEFTGVLDNRIISLVDTRGEISVLPAAVGQLDRLEVLMLHNGGIGSFPAQWGALAALIRLDLVNHNLTLVPAEIANFGNLVELNLIGNNLDTLPEFIYDNPTLLFLNSKDNNLTRISASIKNLTQLRKLNLADNHLTTLPQELRELPYLEYIDVSNNQLCALPAEMETWLNQLSPNWKSTQSCTR